MGKALLIMAAVVIVGGGTLLYSGPHTVSVQAEKRLAEHGAQSLAREVAMTGYNWAVQRVMEDMTSIAEDTYEGSYQGGEYAVTVVNDGDEVTVRSQGRVPYAGGRERAVHVVQARFEHEIIWTPIEDEVPDFMEYGFIAEDDVDLRGNVQACVYNWNTDACDNGSLELNANIHSNGELTVTGNAGDWEGFATSVIPSGSQQSKLDNWFTPNYNPGGAPGYAPSSYRALPAWDMESVLEKVTPNQVSGNVTLNGPLDLGGTRDDPYVWHIEGDLSTNGAEISGYVMFIVEGNIDFGGNAEVGNSGYSETDESSLAFYTSGDVTLRGNSQVWGQIYANGDLWMSGTPDIYGTLAINGQVDLRGTPGFHYRQASTKLATPFLEGNEEEIMEFASYYEWGKLDRGGEAHQGDDDDDE